MGSKANFKPSKRATRVMSSIQSRGTVNIYNTAAKKGALKVAILIRAEIERTLKGEGGNKIKPKLTNFTKRQKRRRGAKRPAQPYYESGDLAEAYKVLGPQKVRDGHKYKVALPSKRHPSKGRTETLTFRKLATILAEGGVTGRVKIPARPFMHIVLKAVKKDSKEYSSIIRERINEATDKIF